jgi:hypothetical protein
MLVMLRRLCGYFFILIVVFSTGCSQTQKPVANATPREPLDDLGQMLKSLAEENRKPPRKLAELEEVEPMIPLAAPLIRSGDLVYVWGTSYTPGGKKIVAYEQKAPTAGGWVLLQDGTVQEMSASEFSTTDKAK